MKIGDKYLAKESAHGPTFGCDEGELVVINERNIEVCESLANCGILVEADVVKTADELQAAMDEKRTIELTTVGGQERFVAEKKSPDEETSTLE